ncbi:MAG: glycosyltransferase [Clostridia bacterium]|nr:glycosyltransferase [Clostridia bacterium]
MLKVLFFIETLGGGGAEKVLCDLVNHMDRTKFDITVQTLWPSERRKKLADGIRYKSVYPSRSRTNMMRMRIESALGLTYRLHMKDDYDIEAAYLEMGSTKIIASSSNKKAKKVAWVHCDLTLRAKDPECYIKQAAPIYRKFDRVACVSKGVLSSFRDMFGNKPKACVIYNTVDDAGILRGAEEPLPDDAKKRRVTAVTLGRLTQLKGYDRLLEVHKQLIDEGFEYDLWILGEGEEREKLETFVRENGLWDSVRFFGFRTNPYPFIKNADLLVCSSRFEGLSTFVTEGLILGKPIVTTDCTGMHELLGDSEYGIITQNSTEGIYKGIKRCLSQPAVLKDYERKARRRGEEFSACELTRITERFLEGIATEH